MCAILLWPEFLFKIRAREHLARELAEALPSYEFERFGSSSKRAFLLAQKMGPEGERISVNIRYFEDANQARENWRSLLWHKVEHENGLVVGLERNNTIFLRRNLLVEITVVQDQSDSSLDPDRERLLELTKAVNKALNRESLFVTVDTFGNRLWEEELKPRLPKHVENFRRELTRIF
ncbi:MAG: hypothetical protein AAF585_05675 [Verrucomicrobiota bacterium]